MIFHGDSVEKLKDLEDNSVDSVVSDPPYGLKFMGKKWDYEVPKIKVWQEVLRVLKPGGHALVACGTRTQHRMAVNLEDAGFEIRDIVAWIYGSGFPKSLNIGKAVDKLQGNEREEYIDEDFLRRNPDSGASERGITNARHLDGEKASVRSKGKSLYEGWGTALKPAMELWTLCRKPLEENTVVENILKHGTGGLNIDGCRVGTNEDTHRVIKVPRFKNKYANGEGYDGRNEEGIWEGGGNELGRFPANLIHDGSDEVVGMFPTTKSVQSMRGLSGRHDVSSPETQNIKSYTNTLRGHNDSGSASRFFYCAKASKSERNKGLEEFEKKKSAWELEREEHHNGQISEAQERFIKTEPRANNHPTVKPISLMRYLCKLITPPTGTVLDPFMGSGSTGIACKLEGFNFIGIEKEEEYVKIAQARIEGCVKQDILL